MILIPTNTAVPIINNGVNVATSVSPIFAVTGVTSLTALLPVSGSSAAVLTATLTGAFTSLNFSIFASQDTVNFVQIGTWNAVVSPTFNLTLANNFQYYIAATTFVGGTAVAVSVSLTNTVTVIQPIAANLQVTDALASTTITGTVAVTQSTSPWVVSGTIAATQSGTWNIGTVTTVTAVTAIINALPTGANIIGKVDVLGNAGATLDAAINGAAPTNVVWTTPAPSTAAAASCKIGAFAALATANVKASAGNVYGCTVQNSASVVIFLQFYNTAGTPTLGTGVVWWIPVAVGASIQIPPGTFALGNFTTGIGIGAATSATGNGVPPVAPNVVIWYE